MSEYGAVIRWQKAEDEAFSDNQYSRGHTWEFDGGITVPASSSPHVVPLPFSVEANVDQEEAFIAALSSCHMLTFLGIKIPTAKQLEKLHHLAHKNCFIANSVKTEIVVEMRD
ncbi:OsmC family protein [Vibrio splendidus]|uniref:OsmC family protein n=1 Tax=Vibrio splendidus TaxID=29497 RepID=UPI000C864186|nr:peroxiredoxin [Vibrio splendidus]PMN21625.1 peroxiredoxin [Vibrio splendidus]